MRGWQWWWIGLCLFNLSFMAFDGWHAANATNSGGMIFYSFFGLFQLGALVISTLMLLRIRRNRRLSERRLEEMRTLWDQMTISEETAAMITRSVATAIGRPYRPAELAPPKTVDPHDEAR